MRSWLQTKSNLFYFYLYNVSVFSLSFVCNENILHLDITKQLSSFSSSSTPLLHNHTPTPSPPKRNKKGEMNFFQY